VTLVSYLPPRGPCDPDLRKTCERTIESRDDVRAVWWLTADDGDGRLHDELHVELSEPPGRDGASATFLRKFEWAPLQIGTIVTSTFTPRRRLPKVKAVAELVAECSK
jgi:hypothetical protein